MSLELIATTAFGLEKVVALELRHLGYEPRIPKPGRVHFSGDLQAIARCNLWLRSAERILIQIAEFEATDFDHLYDAAYETDWVRWIPVNGAFPVRGRSHKSQLSSVPACQRTVKKAMVESLRAGHAVTELPETGATFAIEIALANDQASLTLDTTGEGLHKRGYRPLVGAAPLRETLAAALVQLSFWEAGRPLLDPFCGSGTIAIEAALIGRNMAPGLRRQFAAEDWPAFDQEEWQQARADAQAVAKPAIEERLLATDCDAAVLKLARRHAEAAGVADDIHFQQRDFQDTLSKRQYGCLITNPPYGERLGERQEVEALYAEFPRVLRRLPTWSHSILAAGRDFERLVGQTADRRRKLYNGRIECTLYQYHGPKPPRSDEDIPSKDDTVAAFNEQDEKPPARDARPTSKPTVQRAFGGLRPEAKRQAEEFANRLRKRARHLRRWPEKQGISCYRLYDRDIPEAPLVVDRYEDALHIAEYERPHDRTPAEHADWLDHMVKTAADTLQTPRELVFLKRRERQRGANQYHKVDDQHCLRIVAEGGLKFQVNLSDYLDTGLFLDHRITRGMVRDAAKGKRVLNLFAYTGSFTVYAADGAASETTTVDLSPTYLEWAEENLRLNGLTGPQHRFVQADSREYLESLPKTPLFDLAIVDPPTFSNSKRTDDDWDIQQHAAPLLNAVASRLSPGGLLFFSTNARRFKLEEAVLVGLTVREISNRTVPEDFRNRRIHRCWRMVKQQA